VAGLSADFNPTTGSEVRRLSTIETMIKAGVISSGKVNNELSFFLYSANDRNVVLLEKARRYQQLLVPEELRAALEQVG